ncbi:MAG: hypothetical protein QXF12_04730 [Candidatus Aenigmatarchaeota archaeon]
MKTALINAVFLGLASFGFTFAYKSYPFIQWFRSLVMKYISPKLGECTFCISFWFSMLIMILIEPSSLIIFSYDSIIYLFYSFMVSLASATVSYLIANIVYKLSGDEVKQE